MKHRPIRFERQRDYPISAAEAWRLLADTDHMNRVLRLPAVDFSPPDSGRGFVRTARTRLFRVLPIAWKEHPFDWVHERRYTVERELESGPLARVRIGVELQPLDGGSRVTVSQEFTPANIWGRLLASRIGPPAVAGMIEYCDRYLARLESGRADPLPIPGRHPEVDLARLDSLLQRLADAPIDRRLLAPLRERIREGTDAQVLRLRPYEVADVWRADRFEVLRLFLHATRGGLFELRWELICPSCRVPKGEVPTLAALPEDFHCESCAVDYDVDFDRRVELRFSVHPAVRRAEEAVYCIGGPLTSMHILAQQLLAPGESRSVRTPLVEPVLLRALGEMGGLKLAPTTERSNLRPEIRLIYGARGWSAATAATGAAGPVAVSDLGSSEQPITFSPGELALTLVNRTEAPLLAVLERTEWDERAATAAQVTALQEFRDLFSSDVLAPGHEVGVATIALLFTDLKGSTSLYEGVGDAPAYGRVHRHFSFLREKIAGHRGAVVKTIGDAVMGAFGRVEDALDAALEIQREIGSWCVAAGIDPPLVLRAGVHRGPAIVVNANERLDYFGRTVNIAARLGHESRGADVVLMEEALAEAWPAAGLAGLPLVVETFTARLRGIEEEAALVRVRLAERPVPRDDAVLAGGRPPP